MKAKRRPDNDMKIRLVEKKDFKEWLKMRYPISPLAHIALGYEEVNIPLHCKKVL